MAKVEIVETQDGSHTLFASAYNVTYHSRYGAIQESRHVFITSGLHLSMLLSRRLRILEIGFGSGLNALLTLHEALVHGLQVTYDAVEAYPLLPEQTGSLNYPLRIDPHSPTLASGFNLMHQCPWEEAVAIAPNFTLHKRMGKLEEINFPHNQYDLIYYDAFSPAAQPEMWEEPVLAKMYQALLPGGALVTYCAKGTVKRILRSLGFTLESLPGPPGKREMTRATKPPLTVA